MNTCFSFFYKSNKNGKKSLKIFLFVGALLCAVKGGAALLDAECSEKCSECVESEIFWELDKKHPETKCFCENINILKRAFYYNVLYSLLPSWSQMVNHRCAIMGRAGILLYRREDIRQANNIDLIVSDENTANNLFMTICNDIQNFIYTNYGELMVRVDTRPMSESEVISGTSIKSGYVSLYCHSNLVASIRIVIKPEWMGEIKSQSFTFDYMGSVDILTLESYMKMDLDYIEKELPVVDKPCSLATIDSYLPLALSACRTLHIVKNKMLFYEQYINSHPELIYLFNNLRQRFNTISSRLNKNEVLISYIRDKALQFKYQLGQPAIKFPKMSYAGAVTGRNETSSDDVSSFENLKMLLARDFFVTKTAAYGDCFYQSVANVLNLTQKTRYLFLDACERLLSIKFEHINAQLIREYIHCWIERVSKIPDIPQDELQTFLGVNVPVKTVLDKRYIRESPLCKMAQKDAYWGWVDLLAAISLPTGIPILVLTPDSDSKTINRAVYSAAQLKDFYPGVFLKLKEDPSLYTAQQLSINYLMTIVNVRKSDHFSSCIPSPFLGKKLKPFIISEEMLLNFVPFPSIVTEEIIIRHEPLRENFEFQNPTQYVLPVFQDKDSLTEIHPKYQPMDHCVLIYEDELDAKKTSRRKRKNKKETGAIPVESDMVGKMHKNSQTGVDRKCVPINLPLVDDLSSDALVVLKKLQYCSYTVGRNQPALILYGSVAMLLNAVKDYKQNVALSPRDWDFKINKESLSLILQNLDIPEKHINEIMKWVNDGIVEKPDESSDNRIITIYNYMHDNQNLVIQARGGNDYPVSTLSIGLYRKNPCPGIASKQTLLMDFTLVDDINAYPHEVIHIANIGTLPVLKWEGILNHAEEMMSINPLNRKQGILIRKENYLSYSKLRPKIKIWMNLENEQPFLEENLLKRLKFISEFNARLDPEHDFRGMEVSNNSQDNQPSISDVMNTESDSTIFPPEDERTVLPDIAGDFSSLSLSPENKSTSKVEKPISPIQSSSEKQKPVMQAEKKVTEHISVMDGITPVMLTSPLQNEEKQSKTDAISLQICESGKLSATGDEALSQRSKKKKKKSRNTNQHQEAGYQVSSLSSSQQAEGYMPPMTPTSLEASFSDFDKEIHNNQNKDAVSSVSMDKASVSPEVRNPETEKVKKKKKKGKRKVVDKIDSVQHIAGTKASILSETQPVDMPEHKSPEYQALTKKIHEVKNKIFLLVNKGMILQTGLKQFLSNQLFDAIIGYIADHQKQLKSKNDDKIMVLLDKCDDHVMEALNLTDQLDHPVAPLILGMKKMVSMDCNTINLNEILDIVILYQKAASRRNTQGPVFLYWLAEITGSPEAFSASLQSLKYLTLLENHEMPKLTFKTGMSFGCHIQNSETMLIPIRIKRMIEQQENGHFSHEDRAFLEKSYPMHVNVQAQLTPGLLYQQDYQLAHNEWVNTLIHIAHFGYYYLLIGKNDQAIENFMHAAVAYSLLERAGERIPNIARACGLSSVYHCLNFIDEYRMSPATHSVPVSLQYWNNFWHLIGDALKYSSKSNFTYFVLQNYEEKRVKVDSLESFEAKMIYLMNRLVNTSWIDNHTLLKEIQERHSCFTGSWPEPTDHLVEWCHLETSDNPKKEFEEQDDSKCTSLEECSKQNTAQMIKPTHNRGLKRPPRQLHGRKAHLLAEENRIKLDEIGATFNNVTERILNRRLAVKTALFENIEVQVIFDEHYKEILSLCNEVQQALDFDIRMLRNKMDSQYKVNLLEKHLSNIISISFHLLEMLKAIRIQGMYDKDILEFAYFIHDLAKRNEVIQTAIEKTDRELKANYRTSFKENLVALLDPGNYRKVDETLILLSLKILLIDFDGLLESLTESQRKAIAHLMKQSLNYLDAYDDVLLLLDIFLKIGVENSFEVLLLSDIIFQCWISVPCSFEYEDQDDVFEDIISYLDKIKTFELKEVLISICRESLAFRADEREQLLQKKIEEANIIWGQLWEEEEKTREELKRKKLAEKKIKAMYSAKCDEESDDQISDEDNTVWVFNTDTGNSYEVGGDVLDDDLLFHNTYSKKNMETEKQSDSSQQPDNQKTSSEHIVSYTENKEERYFKDNLFKIIKLARKKSFKPAIDKLNGLLKNCRGDSLVMARIYMLKSDYQLEMLKLERREFKDKELAEYFKKVMVFARQYEQARRVITLPAITKSDTWHICNHMEILMEGIESDDHPLNCAVRDLAEAVDILEIFLEDADDRQDLYRIKTEFDLLSAGYEYLKLNLIKIINSCDLISQFMQDRHYILLEIQKRQAIARERRSELTHLKKARPVNKLLGWRRDVWNSQRVSMKKKENPVKEKPSYHMHTSDVKRKMETIKKKAEFIKERMPNQATITSLKLLLQQ